MTAADTVEITTPESDYIVKLGDAYHRTHNHCDANHCLAKQTDATNCGEFIKQEHNL